MADFYDLMAKPIKNQFERSPYNSIVLYVKSAIKRLSDEVIMFARLKEHARNVDADLQTLERNLELKLKPLFSITQQEVSESSLKYCNELVSELNDIDSTMQQMIEESQELNESVRAQYSDNLDKIKNMTECLVNMENHLEQFGYVRDTSHTNGSNVSIILENSESNDSSNISDNSM